MPAIGRPSKCARAFSTREKETERERERGRERVRESRWLVTVFDDDPCDRECSWAHLLPTALERVHIYKVKKKNYIYKLYILPL